MSLTKPDKATGIKWSLIGFCFLGSFVWLLVLFGPSYDSDPAKVADLGDPGGYVEALADRLREDPVYVDPVLAPTLGDLGDDQVRTAVADSSTPVYLMVVPTVEGDRYGGHADVLLARTAQALGEDDGVLLLVDQDEVFHTETLDGSSRYLAPPSDLAPVTLADVISNIDDDDTSTNEADGFNPFETPVFYGLMFGAVFSVPIWFLGKLLRRLGVFDRRYLKGFHR